MGKYTPQSHWPADLKEAAASVTRAKLIRKWRKASIMQCEDEVALKYCLAHYFKADAAVNQAKGHFDDLYSIYHELGDV